jgi:hypothetical protein
MDWREEQIVLLLMALCTLLPLLDLAKISYTLHLYSKTISRNVDIEKRDVLDKGF